MWWPMPRPPRAWSGRSASARAHVNDILPLSRRDPVEFKGARMAWERARAQAGIANEDLSFVETYPPQPKCIAARITKAMASRTLRSG